VIHAFAFPVYSRDRRHSRRNNCYTLPGTANRLLI
jgi:hypothetical protein